MRAVEMKYLQSPCGVKWRDRWIIDRVLEQCGEDMDEIEGIKKSKLRYFDMEEWRVKN